MPQLDILSWFDQVFSTLVVIFIFYFFLSSTYLPALNSINKARFKMNSYRQQSTLCLSLQLHLLMVDTHKTLAVLLGNNVLLMDSVYQLTAGDGLVQSLTQTCYISGETEAALQQLVIDRRTMIYIPR